MQESQAIGEKQVCRPTRSFSVYEVQLRMKRLKYSKPFPKFLPNNFWAYISTIYLRQSQARTKKLLENMKKILYKCILEFHLVSIPGLDGFILS
jgi:hypothetical protein